jgi:hypothetical protein
MQTALIVIMTHTSIKRECFKISKILRDLNSLLQINTRTQKLAHFTLFSSIKSLPLEVINTL